MVSDKTHCFQVFVLYFLSWQDVMGSYLLFVWFCELLVCLLFFWLLLLLGELTVPFYCVL